MVCERHFTHDDFIVRRRQRALQSQAIPSIFDEAPNVEVPVGEHIQIINMLHPKDTAR